MYVTVNVTSPRLCVSIFIIVPCQSVSAVPVLNSEGKLVGNISSHDIKALVTGKATFGTMAKPVGDNAFRIHGTHIFTCTRAATLEEVRLNVAWLPLTLKR